MKAFLNTAKPPGGPHFLDADRPCMDEYAARVKVWEFAAEWAQREALMILAETEPDHVQSGHVAYHGGRVGPDNARRFLAEALEAFVESPECAVCGAPFNHGCNSGACSEACERAADS